MQFSRALATASVTVMLAGCASTLLSEDRLKSNTAGVIGVPADQIVISNRREEPPNTYYSVATRAGAKYNCVINGGNFWTAGMVNPPTCGKPGQAVVSRPPFAK